MTFKMLKNSIELPENHPLRNGLVSFVPKQASTSKDLPMKFLGMLTPAEAEAAGVPSSVLVTSQGSGSETKAISPLEAVALSIDAQLRASGRTVAVETESDDDAEYVVYFPPNRGSGMFGSALRRPCNMNSYHLVAVTVLRFR